MNREYRFRRWDGEEMRYMSNMFVGVAQIGFSEDHYVDLSDHDHEDSALMQYTGLKDKNGVEIYEGDIVQAVERWPGDDTAGEAQQVRYDSHGCAYFHPFGTGDFSWTGMRVEVIGNIYENPVLLRDAA